MRKQMGTAGVCLGWLLVAACTNSGSDAIVQQTVAPRRDVLHLTGPNVHIVTFDSNFVELYRKEVQGFPSRSGRGCGVRMELPMSGPEPDSTVPTAVVAAEWDTVTCRYVLAYGRMRTPIESATDSSAPRAHAYGVHPFTTQRTVHYYAAFWTGGAGTPTSSTRMAVDTNSLTWSYGNGHVSNWTYSPGYFAALNVGWAAGSQSFIVDSAHTQVTSQTSNFATWGTESGDLVCPDPGFTQMFVTDFSVLGTNSGTATAAATLDQSGACASMLSHGIFQ